MVPRAKHNAALDLVRLLAEVESFGPMQRPIPSTTLPSPEAGLLTTPDGQQRLLDNHPNIFLQTTQPPE